MNINVNKKECGDYKLVRDGCDTLTGDTLTVRGESVSICGAYDEMVRLANEVARLKAQLAESDEFLLFDDCMEDW